jgi:hypothetical protein
MPEDPKPTPAPIPFLPLVQPTLRCSDAFVWLDGGSFGLTLTERRGIAGRPDGLLVMGDHEVGRFAMTPVALQSLRSRIDIALAQYKTSFGVDPPKLEQMPVDAMEAAKRSLLGGLPLVEPNAGEPPEPQA